MSFVFSLLLVQHLICWAVALGTKALIGVVAVGLAYIANKKGPETSSAVWFGIPTAIVVNVFVAVLV